MAKRLGQLLQEQQEPFRLKVYLLERNYNSKNTTSKHLPNAHIMSLKLLKTAAAYSCSKMVRSLFNKLLATPALVHKHVIRSTTTRFDQETISSATASTLFNSCSDTDADSPHNGQVDTDGMFQIRRCMDDSKQQLSPISVLEETLSTQNSPIYNDKRRVKKRKEEDCKIGTTRKMRDETIFSVSLCKLAPEHYSSTEKPIHNNDMSSEYIKIKLVLQETKQLLFDSVRQVIETARWNKRKQQQQQQQEFLGAEELGDLLRQNMLAWSKQTADGTKLLTIDQLQEWGADFEQQRKDIAVVIASYISQELISELVTDMVSSTICS